MRKFIDGYYRLLNWLLVATVAILIVPVSLQIFSRFTALIPSYIWTEEMARFFFIWMIMIGAMVGIRDGAHFDVDLWPELKPRANALLRVVSNVFVLVLALVFIWYGIRFVQFGWSQNSELAELPMPFIFAAWPLAGFTGCCSSASNSSPTCALLCRPPRGAAVSSGGAAVAGDRRADPVRRVLRLMALRVPIAFALGLACLPILIIEPRLSPMVLFNQTFKSYNSFILLAVPFFLLTANLMNVGGITDRLVRLSRDLVGHLPGGLAQVNVVLSIFFAGISGSSTADAASQGKIFIEAQVKEGYDLSFSVAITAVSAVLAVIIPPSILMIVWGGTLTVSIGALFLAGIIPGTAARLRADGDRPRLREAAQLSEVPALDAEGSAHGDASIAIPALMTPVIIIGGKIFGWFTATESAAIAVLYAGALSIFIYREMSGKAAARRAARHRQAGRGRAVLRRHGERVRLAARVLPDPEGAARRRRRRGAWASPRPASSSRSASSSSAASSTRSRRSSSSARSSSRWRASVHMDPVHFAMIGIVSLAFGLVTPPYGLCLMISCAIAKVRMMYVLKDVMIMLMPMLGVLALTIVFPEIILFLPRLISPEFLK